MPRVIPAGLHFSIHPCYGVSALPANVPGAERSHTVAYGPPFGGASASRRGVLTGCTKRLYYKCGCIVYILYSERLHHYYVGVNANLVNRLARHNGGRSRATKAGVPWKLVYRERYSTRIEACLRERQIKNYHGGEAFKKLIATHRVSGGGVAEWSLHFFVCMAEGSHSGLVHRLGKAAYRKVSRVRIPPPPPCIQKGVRPVASARHSAEPPPLGGAC